MIFRWRIAAGRGETPTMLNVMRENLRSLKPLLWIVAISMMLYLGAYFSCDSNQGGENAPWAARVNGTPISRELYLRTVQNLREAYRQSLGEAYTQLEKQLRIGTQAVQRLVDQQIVLEEARRIGLRATPEEIGKAIMEDPSFRRADGGFVGRNEYTRVVSQVWPGGVPAFESYIAEQLIRNKWVSLVTAPVTVTDEELEAIYRQRTVRTSLKYAVVPAAGQDVSTEVSQEEVEAWYASHADRYRKPEGRSVLMVRVDRQALLPKVEVRDEEIQSYYEENRDLYRRDEERRARHILIRVPPAATPGQEAEARQKAESILKRIREGEDFATLARQLSEDPGSAERGGDLGFFGRGQMVADFDKAVFSTPVGELVGPIRSPYGFHVIQVTDERPAGVTPLDEVRETIRNALRRQKAEEAARETIERIRARLEAGEDPEVLAPEEGAEVQEIEIRQGRPPADLGASPEFVQTVFQLDPGTLSPPLPLVSGWAVVRVQAVLPAAVAPLEEVRQQVITDILNHRATEAALRRARESLRHAKNLEQAAKRLGVEVREQKDLAPGSALPGTGGRSQELENALFGPDTRPGVLGVASVPAGAVVYEVLDHRPFDQAAFEAAKEDLRQEILEDRRNRVVQSLLDELRTRYVVEVNEPLVQRYDA